MYMEGLLNVFAGNVGANPGLAAIWEDERQRQRNRGESSQLTPPDSQG